MAEKISFNKKGSSNTNDLILKKRIKLLVSDYDNNINFLAVVDINKEFVFANSSLLNTFQYSFQELKTQKVSDLFHSTDKLQDINKILLQIEKSSWSGEVLCCRKDDSTFDSKLKITPILGSNGNICGYELISTNVEGAGPNYKKLFEFLLRLEKSHHAFPDLLIITDENRDVIEFKYFDIESDYFVLKPEEGTKLEDILPHQFVHEIDLTINKIKSGPQTIYHEFSFTINDSEKIFEAEITRIDKHSYSVSLRDVTKIKLEKRELKDSKVKFSSLSRDGIGSAAMRILNEDISNFIRTKDGRFLSLEGNYSPVIKSLKRRNR